MMNNQRLSIRLALVLLTYMPALLNCYSQSSAGSETKYEPRYLVDMPTAGVIPQSSFVFDLNFFQDGGILTQFSVGAFNRLVLGVAYGGSHVIGNGKIEWNQTPGVSIKLRIIEENIVLPAIALGIDTQGKENYIDSLNRYSIKSPGIYAIASKNYAVLGFLSLHGGINHSFENADGDNDLNVYFGIEKSLGSFVSLIGEYDLGINDSGEKSLGEGRGYLNLGIRVAVGVGLTLGCNLKDIIKNQHEISIGSRTIQIEYNRGF